MFFKTADFFSFARIEGILNNISLGVRDIFDILIIAVLIYAALHFLRKTNSLSIIIGILSVAALYGISVFFDLPLTHLVLRSFFGIFLILLVVIFQREIRRFFGSFQLSGMRGHLKGASFLADMIEVLSHTVFVLARRKIGAIIVCAGREPIYQLLEGGHRLGGEISEPLLLSIFDTSSPGHDGALVIEGGNAVRFGVQLPLADPIQEHDRATMYRFGTRHRAALGLSERSDACVMAVSEERGTVSMAYEGKLEVVFDKDDLSNRLILFYRDRFAPSRLFSIPSWIARNSLFLAISLIISFSVWLGGSAQFSIVQRNFTVTPNFKGVPSEYVVDEISPREIIVGLRGRNYEFDTFSKEQLNIVFDVRSASGEGWHQYAFSKGDIRIPLSFSVAYIEPETISFHFARYEIIGGATTTLLDVGESRR